MPSLVDAVQTAIRQVGDPDRAISQQRYMKSSMPYRGITSPELKALLRPILAEHALADRTAWDGAVRALWDDATYREERYAATTVAGHRRYRAWQDPSTLELYRDLIVTGAWWDHVDEIANRLVGPILRDHSETVAPLMRVWARDDDRWIRRTAIICQLGARDALDTALLRDAIEPNLSDPDFFVRKAIGWALRQHARVDPDWVRAFVAEHDGTIAALSRREALKHL